VQWRLGFAVAGLMLGLFGLKTLAPKELWHGWFGAQAKPLLLEPAEIATRDIDTAVPRRVIEESTDEPGLVVLRADEGEIPDGREPAFSIDGVPTPEQPLPKGPILSPELLDEVQDNAVLRIPEREAWLALFQLVRDRTPEEIRAVSEGRVGFVQLYEQPQFYRGRGVTIRGNIRRAEWEQAPKNALGIEGYWRCFLFPAGGPPSPIIVYFLVLPPGFPTGVDVNEEIEATGFFFKRMAYHATDTLRLAPLVIARTPQWTPPEARPSEAPQWEAIVGLVVVALLVAILIAWLAYYWSVPRVEEDHRPFAPRK
jgi:hypothetical protein